MRRRRYFLLILLFAGTALWAVAQPTPEELENRGKLEAIRKNPEQLAGLRENLKLFLALPEKRQEKIRQLDHDLHELPAARKDRYSATLDRYADWLDQLRQQDPAAYRAIKDAPDPAARLALIKERRDREWVQTQPKAQRDQWEKLPAEARADFVLKLRQEERHKHQQWVIAQRFWKELETKKELPCRLSDFSDKVKNYVKDFLLPKLTEAELKQLSGAEGRWPDYPVALVEIAGKRPSALPPSRPEELPRKFAELPEPIRRHLIEKKGGKDLAKPKILKQYTQFDGSPNFSSKAVEIAFKDGKVPFESEYLACNFKSLLKPMREFVDSKLVPALEKDPADKRKFADNEGKWPDYPLTIQELSQKYNLQPPWHFLPEPEKWKWDNYRPTKRRNWMPEVVKGPGRLNG